MDDGERRRPPPGVAEYRIQLPERIDARQLLLALGVSSESNAPTLREFAPRFIQQYARANRQRPSGIKSKLSHLVQHLLPLLGETALDRLSPEQVQAVKSALGSRSAKTVNNVLSTLSTILKVAVEWDVIQRMPVAIRSLPTLPASFRFYERTEYDRLQLGGRSAGVREFAVVVLGGDCGLRQAEMRALEWPDVDAARGQISVQRAL